MEDDGTQGTQDGTGTGTGDGDATVTMRAGNKSVEVPAPLAKGIESLVETRVTMAVAKHQDEWKSKASEEAKAEWEPKLASLTAEIGTLKASSETGIEGLRGVLSEAETARDAALAFAMGVMPEDKRELFADMDPAKQAAWLADPAKSARLLAGTGSIGIGAALDGTASLDTKTPEGARRAYEGLTGRARVDFLLDNRESLAVAYEGRIPVA